MAGMWRLVISLVAVVSVFLGTSLGQSFRVEREQGSDTIKVYKEGVSDSVVTQVAKPRMRPYLHPILPPDGLGVLTEIHPDHHLHQTGVYWGLKKVNGRDFFMQNGGTHYRRVDVEIVEKAGSSVSWAARYHLLDEAEEPILLETHVWRLRESGGVFLLDLEWHGEALQKTLVEQFFVGGLFMRMPWFDGIEGEAVNSAGERNREEAEGRRAKWLDVGMAIEGRSDWGHIAVLDHPDNVVHPSPWRVDRQLGVGPSRQILGDWSLAKGEVARERYRLVVYTGALDAEALERRWEAYAAE